MTKNELRDDLVDAIKRVHDAINPYDPFDTAYEASHVANYLGLSIANLTELDEFADDNDDDAVELRAAFPTAIDAFERATTTWAAGGLASSSERKDHQYAIDLLDILDSLK